jgi:hypothetical protein
VIGKSRLLLSTRRSKSTGSGSAIDRVPTPAVSQPRRKSATGQGRRSCGAPTRVAAIREIGEDYAASLTATLIKIVQSNQFPVLAVCHRKKGDGGSSVPTWCRAGGFPLDHPDRATFASDMLFNGAAEQTFPRKMGADAWFDFRNCDRFEIQEQSFMLPVRRSSPY